MKQSFQDRIKCQKSNNSMKMNKMHMYVYTHTHKLLEITWQVLQEMPLDFDTKYRK